MAKPTEQRLEFVGVDSELPPSRPEEEELLKRMQSPANNLDLDDTFGYYVLAGLLIGSMLIVMPFLALFGRSQPFEFDAQTPCQATILGYTESEVTANHTTCSTSVDCGSPAQEEANLCHDLGKNQTCFSQRIKYERKKHLVEINMAKGNTTNELNLCTSVERVYWYTCNNSEPAEERKYSILVTLYSSVTYTTLSDVQDYTKTETDLGGKQTDNSG